MILLFILFVKFFPGNIFVNPPSLLKKIHPVHDSIPDKFSDDSTILVINEIYIEGNEITKEQIILRELLLKAGDTLRSDLLPVLIQKSKENLLNTFLFNYVTITPQYNSSLLNIYINVSERWYIWPLPIFELVDRNFNEWWLSRDISRTNYGFYITRNNFRGRNETLTLGLKQGYTNRYSISYSIPYINKKQTSGLAFSSSYARNHELAYRVYNNKLVYYNDQNTFVRKEFYTGIRYTHRNGIYNTHALQLEYKNVEVGDTILDLNQDFFSKNDSSQQYIGLSYLYKRDCRDLKSYPLKGYYYDLEFVKLGPLPSFDLDILYLAASFRKYWQIQKRMYTAASIKFKWSALSPQTYFNQRALGYGNDYVRGYEYYVVNGQHFALFKSTLKYELVPTFIQKVKYIPSEKFNTIPHTVYLNLFTDMGYVVDKYFHTGNSMSNSLLIGVGIGVDYVSYYNIVARLEYSINKYAETGFYLHFTIPI